MSLGTPKWRRRWHCQLRASLTSLSPWTWTLHWQKLCMRCSRMMHQSLLGTAKGFDSPMTVREDRVLDMPAGFSRAPGDGRLTTKSSARANNGCLFRLSTHLSITVSKLFLITPKALDNSLERIGYSIPNCLATQSSDPQAVPNAAPLRAPAQPNYQI